METTAKKVTASAEPKKGATQLKKVVDKPKNIVPTFDDASNFIMDIGRKLRRQQKIKTQLAELQEFKAQNESEELSLSVNTKENYRTVKYFCDDTESIAFFVQQLETKLLERSKVLEAEILNLTNPKIAA